MVVQPSVTEAQLAFGIPTLAYENIKSRLETDAPIQLFGHEFCARILEVGAEVTGYAPGDRVAARAKLPCGDCSMCNSERGNDCRRGPIIGFQLPGCFAERALLPVISLVKVLSPIKRSSTPAFSKGPMVSSQYENPKICSSCGVLKAPTSASLATYRALGKLGELLVPPFVFQPT